MVDDYFLEQILLPVLEDLMLFFFHFISVNAAWLCLVAFLWGFTNPFIKQAGSGIEAIKKGNHVSQFLAELGFLFTNWKVRQLVLCVN